MENQELEINERWVKLSKLPVSIILTHGSSVQVKINDIPYDLTCVKTEEKDNQDGSKDVIYSLKYNGSQG